MASSAAWETVKKHSRQLSASKFSITSPVSQGARDLKFNKFSETEAPITMQLDGHSLVYQDHQWQLEGVEQSVNQTELIQANKTLKLENQALKLKLALLVDMASVARLDLLKMKDQVSDNKELTQKSNNLRIKTDDIDDI